MEIKYKFFKDMDRALKFNAEVQGDIYFKEDWEFDIELSLMEFSEGLKEEFDYIVVYTTE